MVKYQGFTFKLQPTGEQERLMRLFARASRFVHNKGLDHQIKAYEATGKSISFFDMCKLLPQWRVQHGLAWLKEAPAQSLQWSLKTLDQAYKNFFNKTSKFPKFKKRGHRDSFGYSLCYRLDEANSRINLLKLGWVKYRNSRKIQGEIKNIVIYHYIDSWFMSVQTEREVEKPKHEFPTKSVGIDMGITRFLTLSTSEFLKPLNSYKINQTKLAKAQRKLSRKKKGSSNWRKNLLKVQKIHAKIAYCRKDFLQKASTIVAKNFGIVCVEDLEVCKMASSSNHELNKAIHDQAWASFFNQLSYKLNWLGGTLIQVDPAYTSQECPQCGYTCRENRLTQSQFKCIVCGYTENADFVGSLNVHKFGLAKLVLKGRSDPVSLPSERCSRLSATGTHRRPLDSSESRSVGMV
jgi:putative transposase